MTCPSTPFSCASHCKDKPISLAVVLLDMRMRGADDEIDHVGVLGEDRRQGRDDILDAFVGGQQAEAEQDVFAFDAEQILMKARVDEGHIGNAVRNQIDLRPARCDKPRAGMPRRARS